jgi:hypothetical protein
LLGDFGIQDSIGEHIRAACIFDDDRRFTGANRRSEREWDQHQSPASNRDGSSDHLSLRIDLFVTLPPSSIPARGLAHLSTEDGKPQHLLDLTGNTKEKIGEMAQDMGGDGYDVHVLLVDLPAWKAMYRAWERFQKNPFNHIPYVEKGRFVPPDYVYNVVDGRPALTYDYVKRIQAVKSWRRFSSDVPRGAEPILIEHGTR